MFGVFVGGFAGTKLAADSSCEYFGCLVINI